jgi:hypothetical protein
LSSVVRQGSSEGAWKAMPEIFSGPVTGWPSMRILPMLGIFRPGGELHEGGLAATRGADDGDELAALDLEVDVFHREDVLGQQVFVVGQPDLVEIDEGLVAGGVLHGVVFLKKRPAAAGWLAGAAGWRPVAVLTSWRGAAR